MTPGPRALPQNRWDLLDGLYPDPLPPISVVIAHYDQPAQLARTLAAVGAQDYPPDLLDVVVVDDGSPVAPEVPPGVRLARQADRGFRLAAARNLGIAAARHDLIVQLDADTAPEPGYVRALTRLPALSPDCVTVGRRRHANLADVLAEDPVELAGPAHELPEPRWLREAYQRSRDLLDADDRSYRYVIGAVTACSRSLLEASGGYDESFTSYGGEDWEWAYRAWLAGAVFAHVPGAVAWHDGPDASARPEGLLAARNDEALRLAELVPLPGSGPRGEVPRHVDVLVQLPHGLDEAARFVLADQVLADLPQAAIDGRAADAGRIYDRVRLDVEIVVPAYLSPGALRRAVERVAAEQLGVLTLSDAAGTPCVRVVSRRAVARSERHNDQGLFPVREARTADCRVITQAPDVAAYVGGWA
ncbi:glycosyltransferase [Cellulomonas sp. PhB150]|uniref:glycosyltransferase n=1 Tax=Cellulomonas sp. PhB150 TaxID=2485188 RepID=UPI000FACDBCE|nr:glycosyltransferase [Cellulomonas sp. PhB150]ROS26064.1 glycosyl transferase family 2 [Cellulomonas sp. PhB150]